MGCEEGYPHRHRHNGVWLLLALPAPSTPRRLSSSAWRPLPEPPARPMLAQCELSPSRHLIPGATNKDLHNSVIQNCLSNHAEGSKSKATSFFQNLENTSGCVKVDREDVGTATQKKARGPPC